jgi:phosphoglycerate dehydrogenase-like enzyme
VTDLRLLQGGGTKARRGATSPAAQRPHRPTRPTVLLAQIDSPLVRGVAQRHPDLEVVDLLSGDTPPDDVNQILLTGPRPPDPSTGWRERAAGVAWVHFGSAGIDSFPLEWLEGRTVTCSRGVNSAPIAEFVVASILAAEKRFPTLWAGAGNPMWTSPLGSLVGRTVGLVGVGSIGEAVAARLLPFGVRIVAVRRSSRPSDIEGLEVVPSLEQVLALAEHLVIAAPLTPSTRHLLDASAFARLRPGAHVINVARGAIVDHRALLAAIEDGTVARASLDVTEPEPLPDDHPLRERPEVFLTPHASWSGPGTVERVLDLFSANLERWQRGVPLLSPVDTGSGY